MKKIFALTLVVAIFGSIFAGCSKPAEEGAATPAATDGAAKDATPKTE